MAFNGMQKTVENELIHAKANHKKPSYRLPCATVLKYSGRKSEVYALEQNVTRVTRVCD